MRQTPDLPAISPTAYNVANHQTTFGDKTLTYDNNGNLQTITDPSGTTTYTWNARNQLVGISGPTVTASFVYDALGRRQQKTINGNSTEFLYDGVNPVQETSGAAVLAHILPGLGIDEFLMRTDVVAGTTSNFLTDALGSPIAVTDIAGTMQTEYTYEPFGKTTVTGASNTNPYQYTGRENDGTGLYYYRARYYSPQLQRFISEDPIEFNGGDVNLYGYVRNSTQNFTDPLGLEAPLPIPSFPGVGGSTCVAAGLAGAHCVPPNKSNPKPPVPPSPPPPWRPDRCRFGGCFTQHGQPYDSDYEPIDPFDPYSHPPETLGDRIGSSWSWYWANYVTKRFDAEGY